MRFMNPLNYEKIIESVKKTGKIVLASDASERGSFLHTAATHISRQAFDYLDAPPVVVGAMNWITPPAEMEEFFFPSADWILDSIHEQILPLKGYTPKSNQTNGDILRRNREGV
jgi:2-oxoisovalerate dehydrogenase E1 component